MSQPLTWIEINKSALVHNVQQFRKLIGKDVLLNVVVKANAYGHDLVLASKIFIEAGADWLSVHSLEDAERLREAGIIVPIYVLGYIQLSDLEKAVDLDLRMVVYNNETIEQLGKIGKPVNVHVKVETGTNRQGVLLEKLTDFMQLIQKYENITIEGVATHFANIEDTLDDAYYQYQMTEFKKAIQVFKEQGIDVPIKHCAASAAIIIFPEAHFDMVRLGLSAYGMWPSHRTKIACQKLRPDAEIILQPAFSWKARIAQLKTVEAGSYVSYGCTYQTTRETTLAIIPIGYFDGYHRSLSGKAYVLAGGERAQVLGRIAMNNIIVDVTDISHVHIEDEVVLIGKQGEREITVEQFADWADTINYEITTFSGANSHIPRIIV